MGKKVTIALAGNPNAGKSSIFNNLTRSRQHVGNYPGVTVEKMEGSLKYGQYDINVVDLPGTYSLTAHSLDELVARNFVIEEKPDVVIDIIDASNLERNLYLATQFIELGVPLVLAFNMTDIADEGGFIIDKNRLSELLGTPIVFTVATKKKGMDELLDQAIALFEGKTKLQGTVVRYGKEIQEEILKLESVAIKDPSIVQKYPSRWLATKLLEGDSEVIKQLEHSPHYEEIISQAKKSTQHLEAIFGDKPEAIIAERRYGFISGACSEAVQRTYEIRHSASDEIDKVLVNRILGLPIFLGLVWAMFKLTFTLSQPLMSGIELLIQRLSLIFSALLPQGSVIQSLVVNGIIAGVGSVLVFAPVIFLLFLALAALEDSGYMARAAFIMDRLMHKIGLHGRSFIPMLLGFACNLPAIMATRTIDDRRDRLVTILINPFMSCGARLPVYALFIGAFFPARMAGTALFSLYLLGITVAIIMAKVFRKYLFKGEAAPFVMELPPYRMPTFKGLLIHMWERGAVYLKKAGTVIFAGSILIWALSNLPWNVEYSKDYDFMLKKAQQNQELIMQLENEKASEKLEKSYVASVGRVLAPAFKPLGFGDWRIATALVGGFVAKEIVVAMLGTLYSSSEAEQKSASLRLALQKQSRPDGKKMFTPLVAYSFMAFVLLYIPCMATIAVIKHETNSWVWPAFAAFYTTAVAWIVSFIIYQGGKLLGLG